MSMPQTASEANKVLQDDKRADAPSDVAKTELSASAVLFRCG